MKEIAFYSACIKVPEFIFVIVVSTTMLNINGKLFWPINLLSLIPKLLTTFLYVQTLNNETNLLINCMPIGLILDTSIAFMYFFETLLQGLDTFYVPYAPGKILANIVGIIIVVAYCVFLFAAFDIQRKR